jgi:hypothetical protein
MRLERRKLRLAAIVVLGVFLLALAGPRPAQAQIGGAARNQAENILFDNRQLIRWEVTLAAGVVYTSLNALLIGLDTFNNPAQEDRRALALSRSAAALAMYLTFYPWTLGGDTPLPFGMHPFMRLGLMTFLASEASANFSNVNNVPQGFGTVSRKQTWALPIYVGVALAATQFGLDFRNLWFELYLGGLLTHWSAALNVTEPGQNAAIALTQSWTTFDPSFGFAVRYYLANLGTIGAMMYWTYIGSHQFGANSPNYATQSYNVSFERQVATTFLLTFSIALDQLIRRQYAR